MAGLPDRTESRPPSILPTLVAAACAGIGLGLARDPTDAIGPIVSAALFLVAATASFETALLVAIASTAVGIFGRVPLMQLGVKPLALRAEEAAVLGLAVNGGLDLWRRRETWRIPVVRAWLQFTALAGALLAASFLRWGTRAIPGAAYFVRWVLFGTVLLAAVRVAHERTARTRLVDALVGTAVALSIVGFVQRTFFPDMADLKAFLPQLAEALTDPHLGRLVSTVLDPNLLGAMLAMAATIAFARALLGPAAQRRDSAIACGLIVLALGLTVSRGSMLATVVGFAVVCVLVKPKLLWLGVAAVPALAVLAPRLAHRFGEAFWAPYGVPVSVLGLDLRPEPSAYARLKGWLSALEVAVRNPVLGVGYNNIGLGLAEVGDEMAAYNGTDASLLLVAGTCGVAGLALYLRLLWRTIADGRAARRLDDPEARALGTGAIGGLVALVLASTFTNALLYTPTMVLVWTLAGVAAGWASERDSAIRSDDLRPSATPSDHATTTPAIAPNTPDFQGETGTRAATAGP